MSPLDYKLDMDDGDDGHSFTLNSLSLCWERTRRWQKRELEREMKTLTCCRKQTYSDSRNSPGEKEFLPPLTGMLEEAYCSFSHGELSERVWTGCGCDAVTAWTWFSRFKGRIRLRVSGCSHVISGKFARCVFSGVQPCWSTSRQLHVMHVDVAKQWRRLPYAAWSRNTAYVENVSRLKGVCMVFSSQTACKYNLCLYAKCDASWCWITCCVWCPVRGVWIVVFQLITCEQLSGFGGKCGSLKTSLVLLKQSPAGNPKPAHFISPSLFLIFPSSRDVWRFG